VVAAWVDDRGDAHAIVPLTREVVRPVDVAEQADAERSCLK
jgi:hypothetical protein